ncbi:MAG: hypothetical protein ACFCUM_17930 [Bacteroidales bacterium]
MFPLYHRTPVWLSAKIAVGGTEQTIVQIKNAFVNISISILFLLLPSVYAESISMGPLVYSESVIMGSVAEE